MKYTTVGTIVGSLILGMFIALLIPAGQYCVTLGPSVIHAEEDFLKDVVVTEPVRKPFRDTMRTDLTLTNPTTFFTVERIVITKYNGDKIEMTNDDWESIRVYLK